MKEEPVSALGALYQGEKSDATGIFNVAMAMMGIAAAYIVAAVGIFGQLDSTSWIVVIALPIPLWLIAGFHSLLTLNGMMHGASVQILENHLYRETDLPPGARKYVGSKGADRIMDIGQSHPIHKVTTAFVYGGVALAVVGFTGLAVYNAWGSANNFARYGSMIGYVLAAGVVAGSWGWGMKEVNEANGERDRIEEVEQLRLEAEAAAEAQLLLIASQPVQGA